jgi:ADP-ribose diphosphatase
MHFRLLEKEKVYRGNIVDLSVHRIEYRSGTKTKREVVEHPGGAVILAVLDDNSILMVRQYRHPVESDVTELPAGKLDNDEDPLDCAKRELREETGYQAEEWTKLIAILTTPGFCNEKLHIFLAQKISPAPGGQALEEGEASLKVLRIPLDEAVAMIERGEIVDGKSIAGIMIGERRLRER